MLTLKIKYEYDYGDIIKDNIHSLLYSFNADEYLNMFINCCSNYEMPSDLPQIVSNFVYASDDLSYLLKLPYVKELVENICLNEKTRRNCSRFFDKFVPVFVQDFSYFKNLIIKEETLFDNCKLVSIIPYFFETLDKEKLKEAVNYFSDIISYSSEASLIYRRIYELYKKYDFDYEFYLYKSFEVKPSKEMFLIIYKDKKTFSEYFGKIKEISLPLKDNFIDFLLGRLRFEDYLESINNLSEYQQTEVFGYLFYHF